MSSSSAGADGVPQAYGIVRKVQRRIGDNALCIRKWPAMEGRIYGVEFAPDGKSFAAVSSLDGNGRSEFLQLRFQHGNAGRHPGHRGQGRAHGRRRRKRKRRTSRAM